MTVQCSDKTCSIANNMDLTRATPEEKKATAKALDATGNWTDQRIADALGMERSTITKWRSEFVKPSQTQPRTSKRGRKNEGRPRKAPQPHAKADAILAHAKAGKSDRAVAKELGVGERTVRREVEHDAIRREAEAQLDPTTLSPTAQEKLAIALRQQARQQAQEFEQRVSAEVLKRTEKVMQHAKEIRTHGEKLIKARKGLMTAETFKLIWSCLHPDSRRSISDAKLEKAFNAFEAVRYHLCDEKQMPIIELRGNGSPSA